MKRRPWLRAALVTVAVVVAASVLAGWLHPGGILGAAVAVVAALRRPAPRRDGAVRRVTLPLLDAEPSPEAAAMEALAAAEHAEVEARVAAAESEAGMRRRVDAQVAEHRRMLAEREAGR